MAPHLIFMTFFINWKAATFTLVGLIRVTGVVGFSLGHLQTKYNSNPNSNRFRISPSQIETITNDLGRTMYQKQ